MKIMQFTILGAAGLAAFAAYAPMTAPPKVANVVDESKPIKLVVEDKTWTCPTCSPNEKYVLQQLQEHTKISDRNALATIMGNIKQESKFIPNICEGGARVSYLDCTRGGYGLIQWTSLGRYNNLGKFCAKYGCDPSSLEGQTRYMINESVFQRYLPEFEGMGRNVSQYMVPAYYWLGWGIKGNREIYAWDYSKKLTLS
ncbi:hypothetical protein Sn250709_204 [Synechococcus phage S-RIM2]|jgi:hypothetical protein|uniref:Phage tail lysozyme domain-containing protein n=5 Tax=Caudoviricetes TaxID=2731619 RepID=A0A1D7RNC0_9CAUD|nr:hypothetical protein SWTG_00170 [Synechococcus phage S-RIM2 R1_1999]AGH06881.1 hypothetical protein SWRG_00187 [Synechococcus phage S-RIM2 R21_2007]AGH07091.1 hypothetical protein SWUG_00182 [Synechococcus phage S-RIM2 R9_2006]AON97716.1 hypothetical protein Fa020709_204 [Synechococcus phage S-RIM2]CAF32258.1 hypothetical protein [Synechococcus phage S-WHM1]AGH07301.1 hypothetical protein SWTG_00170 [Synechococcus phage S-RIM2 R1_1999]